MPALGAGIHESVPATNRPNGDKPIRGCAGQALADAHISLDCQRPITVMRAKAGIQQAAAMAPRFRGGDEAYF